MSETLGQKIASRRKLQNLSQEAIADQLNVSRQAVSKWESDAAIPEIDNIIALCRIFEVNIGWLLGTEDTPYSPTALHEDQMKAVDALISGYQSAFQRKKRIITVIFAGILAFSLGFILWQFHGIRKDNIVAQEKIALLSAENKEIRTQLDALLDMADSQNDSQSIVSRILIEASMDDAQENIDMVLYLMPKVYQPQNTAYLNISNPITGSEISVECPYAASGFYVARFTIPAEDGHVFVFRLVNDYGYTEEVLTSRDDLAGYAYLRTYTTFHLGENSSQFHQMQTGASKNISADQSEYQFNEDIFTPHIFHKSAVTYKHITISLQINGEVIWEKAYTDDFKAVAAGNGLNGADNGVNPDIRITLPQLHIGDEIQLVLTAETVNGGKPTQAYHTVLDRLTVE